MNIFNITTVRVPFKVAFRFPRRIHSQAFNFCLNHKINQSLPIGNQSILKIIMERLQQHMNRTRYLESALIKLSMPDENEKPLQINPEKARIQLNKLAPTVALYEEISVVLKNEKDLTEMMEQTPESQKEERLFLQSEIKEIQRKKYQLIEEGIKMLVPPDLYDDIQEVLLEFRPGAGGSESALFVEDASNMILGYCGSMGWKTTTTNALKDTSINRGYKLLAIKVQGPDVYKYLKCQSGVHKVIRVPETESKGRLHSSTISLAVIPSVPFDFSVNEKQIRYQYMKASGPGGQSVNKTESACRAIHIPTGLSVSNQQDRSQDRNRKRATQILKQKLFEIQYKKNVEEQSRKRKSQIGTMDRSEKIRTYNYPQDRITDHRTGLTLFGIDEMMQGQYLDRFIAAYQEKLFKEKLELLIEELKNEKNNI